MKGVYARPAMFALHSWGRGVGGQGIAGQKDQVGRGAESELVGIEGAGEDSSFCSLAFTCS